MPDAEEWDGNMTALQDEAERNSLFRTIDSFYQYRHQTHYNTTHRRRQNFYALPRQHQEMLSGPPFNMRDRFNAVDAAIDDNAVIAECILKSALETFGFDVDQEGPRNQSWKGTSTVTDLVKVSTIINQFYRDWSAEGAVEREAHFRPVVDQLEKLFHSRVGKENIRVLVPGAGLGRLVFDICNAGFSAEGNEISYHALLASSWILNNTQPGEQYSLHPFVTRFSNNAKLQDQLKMVRIPDVHPGEERQKRILGNGCKPGEMSMSASDFLTAYQQEGQAEEFDAVATVFFIDTAPNVIRYIEAIRHTLKSGGCWINLGPLLWHFENKGFERTIEDDNKDQNIPGIEEPGGVELTKEDIIALIQMMGFEIDVIDTEASQTQESFQASLGPMDFKVRAVPENGHAKKITLSFRAVQELPPTK